MVDYSFDYHVNYVELDPAKVSEEQPDFCLEEQAPHIRIHSLLKRAERQSWQVMRRIQLFWRVDSMIL